MSNDEEQLSDTDYLEDLAERLRHIPASYGTDDYDIDRLYEIAKKYDSAKQFLSSTQRNLLEI